MSEENIEEVCEVEESTETAEVKDFASPEKQEARAFLRERFLRFVTGIVGERVNFNLYENSKVTGEFRGCDVDCLNIFVGNLQTPLGKIPEAILRSSDIVSMDIETIKASENITQHT